MAITVTQAITAVNGSGVSTIVLSPSSTASGATIVVAANSQSGVATINSVTDNQSNTYVQAVAVTRAVSGEIAEQWYAKNCTAGVTSITVTYSANVSAAAAQASGYELAGCHATAPLGQTSTGTGSETDTAIDLAVTSFTPAATDSIIVSGGKINAATTSWSQGTGYTLGNTATRLGTEYKIRAGSGDETAPLVGNYGSSANRTWAYVAAEYKPAASTVVKDLVGVGIIPFAR